MDTYVCHSPSVSGVYERGKGRERKGIGGERRKGEGRGEKGRGEEGGRGRDGRGRKGRGVEGSENGSENY